MNEMKYAVAVDGPSGAGKSTLAKAAAKALGITYVDTGAIYRVIGVAAQRRGIDPKDGAAVTAMLPALKIALAYGQDGLQRMYLNGEDVTDAIRLPEISMYASAASALPQVRSFLLEMQRQFARERSVIMDGRDIGTVVLPDAELKIFLVASPEARAKRRFLELQEKGSDVSYEEVLRDLIARDEKDTSRAAAPLKKAEDAIEVDSSDLNAEETFALLCEIVIQKLAVHPEEKA